MMTPNIRSGEHRIASEWLAAALVGVIVLVTLISFGGFYRSFSPVVEVTVTADRSGLMMEPNSKVKLRGVQVGRVSAVQGGSNPVSLTLDIDPDQIPYLPANVEARIEATTLFGAKFVDLVYPPEPSGQRLAAGAIIKAQNVSPEVNTIFESLVALIKQIDPSKLNAVISAMAQALRGQGPHIGEATAAANEVMSALNDRTETLQNDWQALEAAADVYSGAAQNILDVLAAATTTSTTLTSHVDQLDALLVGVMGFGNSGVRLLTSSNDNFIKSVNMLEPTTSLLLKYSPELTCLLVGAQTTLDSGLRDFLGGANGKSAVIDSALLLGADPYRYPDNLPIHAAKGGPGGQPGCGSLPDVAKNWPVRQLISNTGYGTGLDWRPNPGIGFPGYADYLPVTRAAPEPPSIRYEGGPAPGPIPYPGAPPYGAPQYAPDGTPLYPGVPPAPGAQPATPDAAPPGS